MAAPASKRFMSSLPSHTALAMPALSPTMTTGNIAKWMVKPGDKVAPGDHLCDVETDKATIGWEAQEDGYVAKILVEDGASDVPVGSTVLVICDEASDVAAFKDYKPDPSAAAAPAPAAAAAKPAEAPKPAAPAPAPAAPVNVANAAPKPGAKVMDAIKGKSWAYSAEFGKPAPQCTYY
jgi:pyruvate dehydrogenase E2 component (dihydrolipoamide acetyltransferase)